jgi:glyoxylate reductase
MKPTAIPISTAQGPVVDPAGLYDALKSGQIAAAALDVTDPEQIPTDDPLLELDDCLIVPHIASSTRATRDRMAEMAAANRLAGIHGEALPNQVVPAH